MRKGGGESRRLDCALAVAVLLVGFAARAGHAQSQCATEFQERTSGPVSDGDTLCQTAVGMVCSFELALCVNQARSGCTPQDLKTRRIRAAGHCAAVRRVNVKANGTGSACGSFATVKVRTKKHGTKARTCSIHAKAGKALTRIALLCQPQPGLCPTPPATSTTLPAATTTTTGPATTTTQPSATTTTVAPTTSTTGIVPTTTTTTTGPAATTTTTSAATTTTQPSTTTIVTTTSTTTTGILPTTTTLPATTTTTTTATAATTTTQPSATTTSTTGILPTTTTLPATTTTTTSAPTTTTQPPVTTTSTTIVLPTTTIVLLTTTSQSTTTTTAVSTTTTTTLVCCGFPPKPGRMNFTTGTGSGNCGTVVNSSGLPAAANPDLACGGLYIGGGGNTVPLPYAVPDTGSTMTKVTSCGGTALTLGNLTSTDTGSIRNCSSVGCFFGPPLPVPNSATTPTSVCAINIVATDASGTADCSSGTSFTNLPLTSALYLDGDLEPNAPGIQVCPVCTQTCNAGTNLNGPCNSDAGCPSGGAGSCTGPTVCHGGPSYAQTACTPADTNLGATGPTSHDCPPPAALSIGSIPVAFALTSGTMSKTGFDIAGTGGQNRIFCGYCRDENNLGSGCFAGDQTIACPMPRPALPIACTSNADCPAAYPDCQQRSSGAFGPGGGSARTISETGIPGGDITDGLGHASTVVSIFCIPPTFTAAVDNAGDLPGPGAVSLPGTLQLLP